MPLTSYSDSQKATLNAFPKITNFRAKSFAFYNKKTGERLDNAISINQNGEMVIRDNNAEIKISDVINRRRYISEKTESDGNDYLYFEDDNNTKISLGDMYYNVQQFVNSNLVFWFHARAEQNITGGLDRFIIEDVFESYREYNINDSSVIKDYVTKQFDHWKNKWHDIPCMEVETPPYVSNKVASISAKVVMKVRCDKPLYTGFRIVDSTTGFELARTVHTTKGQHGKPITYTIPLSYQGPLPDTEIPVNGTVLSMTYKDIANVQIEGDDGKFVTTPMDKSLVAGIASTKHIIKMQWIACDFASEVMKDGEVLETLFREFDPNGVTSLDVSIFSKSPSSLEYSELNGQINFDEIEGTEYEYSFKLSPFGIHKEYPILLSANKNVNLSIVHKSVNGFMVKTSRKIKGLVVDWSITYDVDPVLVDDILNDPNREPNHYLFRQRDSVLDFCGELRKIGQWPPFSEVGGGDPKYFCECCDCCEEDKVDVVFVPMDDSMVAPRCSSIEQTIQLIEADFPSGGLSEYIQKATALGVMDSESVYLLQEYLTTGELCGPVNFPFIKTAGVNNETGMTNNSYSFDLEKKFSYIATLVVKRTDDTNSGSKMVAENNDSAGPQIRDKENYEFFEDLYSNLGLADNIPGGLVPVDYEEYSLAGGVSNTSPTREFKNKFTSKSRYCDYSFENNSIVTSKVVESDDIVRVFKILSSEVAVSCEDNGYTEIPPVVEVLPEPFIEEDWRVTEAPSSTIIQYNISYNKLFSENLFFRGLDNTTDADLKENINKINGSKKQGLLKLEHDRVRSIKELPVQLVSNNLIRLDLPRSAKYSNYFENSSSEMLYLSSGGNAKTRILPEEGFLGVKAFRHNLLVFDPRPGVTFTETTNPFFPTFNPIYNQKSYDQLLEYIYTAIYPTDIVPVFPNFRVGEFAINGALYNPLYDVRNYRTYGFYQSFTSDATNQQIFLSDPISLYISSIKIGRFINVGSEYYQVTRDLNNSGLIRTNITSEGVIQKVKPSGIMFKKVSQTLYDLNPSLQVML